MCMDCIAYFGWKKIVYKLADYVMTENDEYSCRSVMGEVKSKEQLFNRLDALPLKDKQRIKYIIYPSEEQPEDYLNYDVVTVNSDGIYDIHEKESGSRYMPYTCRQWLNDGKNLDPKEIKEDLYLYIPDSTDDSYDDNNDEDYDMYASGMYELYHYYK